MGVDRIRETLATFGFSEKEIAAYLAVVRRGEATTRAVSSAADVSQGYVYEIAQRLADRGLVTVDESTTPTVIRARPPAEAVESLTARLSTFESDVDALYEAPSRPESPFEVIRSRQTVTRRARRSIDEATHEAFVILSAAAFSAVADELAAAVDRGVFVYCLLASPDAAQVYDDLDDPGTYAHVVRTWEGHPPVFVLRDERAGVLSAHEMLHGRHGDEYAVAFAQDDIASGFWGNYLANVWPMGEERFVVEPPPLPDTFEPLRTGVTAAALHAASGNDLRADLDVTTVETGAETTFTDVPVREVRQNLVEPVSNAFPLENALVVETDAGLVSVGGRTSGMTPFYEEYAAESVTLRRA